MSDAVVLTESSKVLINRKDSSDESDDEKVTTK